MNILFVCSRNKWRSPTAEVIFKDGPSYEVRSAGTAESARVRINEKMVAWADIIFVMEKRHREQLQERFSITCDIVVLNIPDEYQYMDDELVAMLRDVVTPYL